MVTKITVSFPSQFSLIPKTEGGGKVYGERTFEDASFIRDTAKHLEKISMFITHIEQYPNEPVLKAIEIYFGKTVKVTTRKEANTKLVHSFWMCWVHEEVDETTDLLLYYGADLHNVSNGKELLDFANTFFEYDRRDADAEPLTNVQEAIKALRKQGYEIHFPNVK